LYDESTSQCCCLLTTIDNAPSELQKLSLRSETASEPAEARSIHRPTNATLEPPGQVANASPAQGTIGSSIASFHVIPSTVPFEVSSSDLSLPCFSMGVCQKNNGFFGREDILQQIDGFLLPGDDPHGTDASTLRSFAICGLGGMGKTELAVQYAYTRRKHFEAIFWLGADNATLLEDEFARIAARLGLEGADEKNDLAASRELVKGWLTSPGRKTSNNIEGDEVPWLLIFDNVDDMDVLSDYWPTHGHGSVLITSRDPLAKNNVYTVRDGVDLPPFSTQETVDFMQKTTQIRAQGPSLTALSQIADRIQGLPIAVKQIAAIIREFRMSYADFLKFYDREGMQRAREILSRAREGVNDSSLAIVWALDKLSPGANALLCVMSLLHPDNFPEYIVSESNTIDLPEFPSNSAEYYLARANLLQSSLVSQHEESETLSVHRLVQDTAKTLIDDDRLFSVFRAAFSLVSTQWPLNEIENTYDISRHDRCAQIFPSILKLKMGLEELFRQHPGLKVDHSIAKLLNNSGW
jgi:NB-ARC domain